MKTRFIAFVVCVMVVFAAAPRARGEGWFKLPNLNPFAGKKKVADEPKETTAEISEDSANKKRPLFPSPSFGSSTSRTAPKPRSSGPSTWQKFNKGTKDFFTKTKHFLMPWTDKKKSPPQEARVTGRGRTYSANQRSAPQEEKKSKPFFSSFYPAKSAEREAVKPDDESVNNYLRLPRPKVE